MPSRRKRRGRGGGAHDEGGHGGGSERWMVSYADFITLMFVSFLVLFSMARVDLAKFGGLAQSLHAALGPVGPNLPPLPTKGVSGTPTPINPPVTPDNLPPDWPGTLVKPTEEGEKPPAAPVTPPPKEAEPSQDKSNPVTTPAPAQSTAPKPPPDPMQSLEVAFEDLPGARNGILGVALQDRGIVLSIAGSVLFEPGKTTLKPDARIYLDQVAGKLSGVEYPIMVEGTADDQPASGSQALSTWDLAALRAGAVVQYFVQSHGLPGTQFVTIGYGKAGTADHRVNIVVMRKSAETP